MESLADMFAKRCFVLGRIFWSVIFIYTYREMLFLTIVTVVRWSSFVTSTIKAAIIEISYQLTEIKALKGNLIARTRA